MKLGRPTKYKPEYCELLIEHMKKGLSYETFGAVIGVCKQTLYDWEKVQPDFLDAKKEAFLQSQLFWEQQGIEGLYNKFQGDNINSTVWIFNMKNRFKWRDKVEVSGDDEKPFTIGYKPKSERKKDDE